MYKSKCYVDDLEDFQLAEEKQFKFATLSADINIPVPVDGDKFFNKHIYAADYQKLSNYGDKGHVAFNNRNDVQFAVDEGTDVY